MSDASSNSSHAELAEALDAKHVLDTIRLLNESPNYVYALTFNSVTRKWMTVRVDRTERYAEGKLEVRLFSAGNTPGEAARDALLLRYAPEPTLPDAISKY